MKDFVLELDCGAGYSSCVFIITEDDITSDELLNRISKAIKDYSKNINTIEWISKKENHCLTYGNLFINCDDFQDVLKKYGIMYSNRHISSPCYIGLKANEVVISAEDLHLKPVTVNLKHVTHSKHEVYVPDNLSKEEQDEFIKHRAESLINYFSLREVLLNNLDSTTTTFDSVSDNIEKENYEEYDVEM